MTSRSDAEPRWISKAVVLALHERLLAEHGGAAGLRDEGLLESALAGARNHFHYQSADLFDLAAAYAHGIIRNHAFADGNKRLALTITGVFLERNGLRLHASEADASRLTFALAAGEVSSEQYAEWLRVSCSPLQRSASARRQTAPKKK